MAQDCSAYGMDHHHPEAESEVSTRERSVGRGRPVPVRWLVGLLQPCAFLAEQRERVGDRHGQVGQVVRYGTGQHEVLLLLGRGCSTQQIAETLSLSRETVRNHIRGVLRALRVNSRLGALVEGRRRGLLD